MAASGEVEGLLGMYEREEGKSETGDAWVVLVRLRDPLSGHERGEYPDSHSSVPRKNLIFAFD